MLRLTYYGNTFHSCREESPFFLENADPKNSQNKALIREGKGSFPDILAHTFERCSALLKKMSKEIARNLRLATPLMHFLRIKRDEDLLKKFARY